VLTLPRLGCKGSFDLVLLVTHLGEVYCVCTTGETQRATMQQGSLCKGYVVYPWPFTLVVKRVCTTQAGKGSRLVGKVYNLCRVLKTGISASSRLRAALGSSLIRRTLDTIMLMINNDVIKSYLWYFLF
jgi:hypothetical protein